MTKNLSLSLAALMVAGAVNAQALSVLPDGGSTTQPLPSNALTFPAVKPLPAVPVIDASLAKAPAKILDTQEAYPCYNYDLGDNDVNFYAFQVYGLGIFYRGVVHGTTANLSQRDVLYAWPAGATTGSYEGGEMIIDSGCMVGDEYWAYVSNTYYLGYCHQPNGLYRIDLNTGYVGECLYDHKNDPDTEYNYYNDVLQEMSFDPVTGYVYGLQKVADPDSWLGLTNTGTMNVVRIDPEWPEYGFEIIGTVDYSYLMATDNGYMYIIKKDYTIIDEETIQNNGATMYRWNLTNNETFTQDDLEVVGKLNHGFLDIQYYQTMEFDHTTHTLWWMGQRDTSSDTAFLTTIDYEKAETADELESFDFEVQYIALGIPYQTANDAAPSFVRNLTYAVGEAGATSVTFTWDNPAIDYQLQPLDELTSVKVLRDGTEIAELTPSGIGMADTWTDDEVASGNHLYRFVTYNSEGQGLYKERKMFVGRDVPGAVYDINVNVIDDHNAAISWTPAAAGINGGWYDQSSLVYTVTRMPDGVVIADKIAEPQCTDYVEVFKGYYYEIVPSNADGVGAAANSAVVPFGGLVDIPYVNSFSTELEAEMMTVVDANQDGFKWYYGLSVTGDYDYYYSYSLNAADDYLITPQFNFDPAKKYEIRFLYATSNYVGTMEKIEIRQGPAATAEAQTELLGTVYGYPENGAAFLEARAYVEDASKGNYLSIKVASDGDQGWVAIRRIEVREYSETDLSVLDFNGAEVAYVDKENPFVVTVCNEGSAKVKTGKAQIYNKATDETLGEANVGVIEAGATKNVTVTWTPTELSDPVTLGARVVLNGDTYPDDNVWDSYITVQVLEGEVSVWKTVGSYNSTGWRPIYTRQGYSQTETIYTIEEVGLEKVQINGMAYVYEPASDVTGLDEVPVEVYLGVTDEETLDTFLPADIYTKVMSGVLDLTGKKERNDATMMFETPFYYEGDENLAIKLISDGYVTDDNPNWKIIYEEYKWYIDPENPEMRSIFSKNGYAVQLNDQVPFVKLAYTDASGIQGVLAIGQQLDVVDRVIYFGSKQDSVKIYNMAGQQVGSYAETDNVSGLALGVYTVVARQGSDIISTKVVIK